MVICKIHIVILVKISRKSCSNPKGKIVTSNERAG